MTLDRSLPASAFWAKLDEERGRWHPLIAHSADVAAVADRLLEEDSVLRARLARLAGADDLDPPLRSTLVLLAALHDLGKTNHSFQRRRDPAHAMLTRRSGHVRIVLESLSYSPLAAALESILEPAEPLEGDLLPAYLAALCHHGRPYTLAGGALGAATRPGELWDTDPGSDRSPLDEMRRIGTHAVGWSRLDATGPAHRLPESPRFNHLFAGFITLADWIGSTVEAFDFNPVADRDPGVYWDEARERADRACRAIGVVAARPVVGGLGQPLYQRMFPAVFGEAAGHSPSPLQAHTASMPLPAPGGRLLIESETGSGKTEAVLALYARLRAAGRVGGLLFALPTRATASAMHERVAAAAAALYPNGAPPVTLAVGGRDPLLEAGPPILGGQEVQHPDLGDRDLVRWASGHGKKFLAAELVVGTVDQALLAALAVKHAHLRLAGLARHLLVVDEVHSHDRYMLETLRTLLDVHNEAGGVAVLMSATLSEAAKALLGSGTDVMPMDRALARPYPTLSVLAPTGGWQDHGVSSLARSKAVGWGLVDLEGAMREAVAAAQAGARVCVLRNTVRAAQATVAALESQIPERLWRPAGAPAGVPYHSRYAPADRAHLDREILAAFGSGAEGTEGSILVATQVVEQSLDVDFDLLVTDLAPVDVLLQRIGRLHRHTARDPARPAPVREARAAVIAPEAGFDPEADPPRGHGWGTVYENLPALELTQRTISSRPEIEIPRDARPLVEAVYHPDSVDALKGEGWQHRVEETIGRHLGHVVVAREAMLDFERTYPENADRYREDRAIRTRIGDESVRIALDPPAPCWFVDAEAPHVDWRLLDAVRADLDLTDPTVGPGTSGPDGVMEYPFGQRSLRYSMHGWEAVG